MNAQHDCSRQPRRGASDDIDVEWIVYCGPRCKDWRLMTGTVPNFFDTAHAQQELQDWDRMAPVGREFGSPDYERLEELDHLAVNAKGSLLAARRWLDTPNQALGGRMPEEVAKTPEGFEQVRQLLAPSG